MSESAQTPVYTLGELAEHVRGILDGDPTVPITGVAGVDDARTGDLVRAETGRYLKAALNGPASALLLAADARAVAKPAIRVRDPRLAFAQLLELFAPVQRLPAGIHPTAIVAEDVEMGEGCSVLTYAVLASGVRLGKNVVIHAHCVLGERVAVGDDTIIYPNAILYPGVRVGARARIHGGVVLGADGFSYAWDQGHRKIPQIGGLEIGDDVEIGANTCIDRATTGVTRIGAGTKIDNLVQIGHNATIGRHCLIVAHTGISGSARVGDGVVVGGMTGVRDHAVIGDRAQVAGQSGVWGDVAPGQLVSGQPARPHWENLRIQAASGRLPEALRALERLEQRVADLERQLKERQESDPPATE